MNRRKVAAALVVVAVLVAGGWTYVSVLGPSNGTDKGEKTHTPVARHPYNLLNWYDIAWEFVGYEDFLTPLDRIAKFRNRYGTSDGYYAAADYLVDLLESMGIVASFSGLHDSVIGYQPGYGNDSRAIVFGAHLDTDEDGGLQVQQNAGGCAVVAAIAASLSHFRLPINIYYCFYQGNTQFLDSQKNVRALWGSRETVQFLKEQGVHVIASFNFDEVLYRDPLQPESERLVAQYYYEGVVGWHKSRYLAELLMNFMRKSGLNIMTAEEGLGEQTDQRPFWDAGLPAVNIASGHHIDPEFPPQDSTSSPDYNRTQAWYLARAAAATAVYLGMKGNGVQSMEKLYRTIEPYSTARLTTIVTARQHLMLNGTVSSAGDVSIRVYNSTADLLPEQDITSKNFSLTCPEPALIGPATVIVRNRGNKTVTVRVSLYYYSDTDGNGVYDCAQYSWPPPDPPLDWDGDGLPDANETAAGTDIFLPDTDGDGMNDYAEVRYGLDPLYDDGDLDLDSDGLTNLREVLIGTSPRDNDTDNDGCSDNWEVVFRTDPLVNDSALDPDHDNLTNLEEYRYGADPFSQDGDFDGLPDPVEAQIGTDPLEADTDGDGISDLLEVQEHLNPLSPDNDMDLVIDGEDANPRVNILFILFLLTIVPVTVGSLVLWRRLRL